MRARLKMLKLRIGPLWWHSGLQFAVSRVGDVANLFVALFLVPALIPAADLGAVLPLSNLAIMLILPLSIVLQTVLKYLTVFEARGETGKVRRMLRDMALLTAGLSVAVLALVGALQGSVMERMKVSDPAVLWLVAATGIVTCWMGIALTAVQGAGQYYRLTLSPFVGTVARVLLAVLLLRSLQVAGYFAAQIGAMLVTISILLFGVRTLFRGTASSGSYWPDIKGIGAYLLPVAATMVVDAIQTTGEPWVVRHRLSLTDSAGFYVVSTLGMIPGVICTAIMPFLFPMVSRRHERGESTERLYVHAMVGTLALSVVSAIVLGVLAGPIVRLRDAWSAYSDYIPFVWQLGLASALRAVAQVHIGHEMACRRFRFLLYYVPLVLGEICLLYGFLGWPFFKPWLPEGIWTAVDSMVKPSLQFVMILVLGSRALVVSGILAEVVMRRRGKERNHG